MTNLNLAGVAAGSGLSGLLYVETVTNTLSVNGLVISTGGTDSAVYNIPLNYTSPDVLSIINLSISGASASISNFTWPLIGKAYFYDFANKYSMVYVVQSATVGRNIALQFHNSTVGSSVTVPNLTITVTAYLYTYPF